MYFYEKISKESKCELSSNLNNSYLDFAVWVRENRYVNTSFRNHIYFVPVLPRVIKIKVKMNFYVCKPLKQTIDEA